MKKQSVLTAFLLTPLLLTSCLFGSNAGADYPFQKEKIEGTNLLAGLDLTLDKDSKTVKVTFDGFESTSSKLDLLSSRTEFEREVVNEIGIKSKYESEYYFYKVELSKTENEEVTGKLHEKIFNETEGKDSGDFVRNAEIEGVGLYIKRSLYDGKLRSNMEFFYPSVILNHKNMFYNGNTLYETIQY